MLIQPKIADSPAIRAYGAQKLDTLRERMALDAKRDPGDALRDARALMSVAQAALSILEDQHVTGLLASRINEEFSRGADLATVYEEANALVSFNTRRVVGQVFGAPDFLAEDDAG